MSRFSRGEGGGAVLHKLLKVHCIQKTDTHFKPHSNDVHCSILFMKILVHIMWGFVVDSVHILSINSLHHGIIGKTL